MAYHKIEFSDDSCPIPKGTNLGVTYGDDKIFFFGGFDGVNYLDALTIFNLRTNEWENFAELSISTRPSARHQHVIKFIDKHCLVIFGGAHTSDFFNDTFVFNTNTYNWELVTDSRKTPCPRYGMCYDSNESFLYMLAGYGIDVDNQEDKHLDDMWVFDIRSRQWNMLSTVGEEKPKGTGWSCAIHSKIVYCVGNLMLKLYLLNIQTREWHTVNTSGTIVDKLEQYAFNRCDSGSFYVFGGVTYSEESNVMYSLDMIEEQWVWHKLECTGNKPSPRASLTSISLGDSIVYFGGKSAGNIYGDAYAFNPNLGLRWLCLKVSSDAPDERVGHVACHIPALDGILVHGGDSHGKVTNDLYIFKYKEMAWEDLEYEGVSPSLAFHTCVYDKVRNLAIFYGGGDLQECVGELYILDIGMLTWNCPKIKKRIPPRAGHCAFMHPKTNNMIIVGGFIPSEGYTNEIWMFEVDDLKWTQISATTSEGPMPVGRISMTCTVYEYYNESWMYMHAGVNSEIVIDDVWRLNLVTWEWQRCPMFDKSPGPVYGHSAALIESAIFVYAGDSIDNRGNAVKIPKTGILWSLNLQNQDLTWSRYKVEGSIPPKRFHSATVITNDVIIYGGGPDPNIYQLDRNDVPSDAVSFNLFADFILPYKAIPMGVDNSEDSIDKLQDKPKQIAKGVRRSSSRGSTEMGSIKEIDEEEEEEKVAIFGDGVSRRSSISSAKSFTSSRAEELIQKAKESVLVRRKKK